MQIFGQNIWNGSVEGERERKPNNFLKPKIYLKQFQIYFFIRMNILLERTFRIFALEKSLPNKSHTVILINCLFLLHTLNCLFLFIYSSNTTKILSLGTLRLCSSFVVSLLHFTVSLFPFSASLPPSSISSCFISSFHSLFFVHAELHETFISRPNSFQSIYSLNKWIHAVTGR